MLAFATLFLSGATTGAVAAPRFVGYSSDTLQLFSQQCAQSVDPSTMQRVVHVESSGNPYAIGVVGAYLERQPRTHAEAMSTMEWLRKNGYNFSVGIAQVNIKNFASMGLTPSTALNPCANLQAGAAILQSCYVRALKKTGNEQAALRMAFSCYESGNFTRGFKDGYVAKIVGAGAPDPMPRRHVGDANRIASKSKKAPLSPIEPGADDRARSVSLRQALLF